MPEGVMPIQRLGLKQGEGAAQVFDFPEISRDLEYMRANKAAEEKQRRQQELDEANFNREMVQGELNKLDDTPLWYSNPLYYGEVTGMVNETKDFIIDNIGRIAEGDTEAIREMHQRMARTQNRAYQVDEMKQKTTKALALVEQSPREFTKAQTERIVAVARGEMSVEEAEKESSTWNWRDRVNIDPVMDEYVDKYSGLVFQEVAGNEVIQRGLTAVNFKPNIDGAVKAMEQQLASNPMLEMDIASHYQTDPKTATDLFLEDFKARITENVEAELRAYKPLNPDDGTRVTPQKLQQAAQVKKDVNEAVMFGDVKSIERHIQGYGTNVRLEYRSPDGTLVKKIPDGKKAENYTPVAKFFESKISLRDDVETVTDDNVEVFDLVPRNYQAVLNKISNVNEDISKEAIQMEQDPDSNLDAAVDRLRQEGFGQGGKAKETKYKAPKTEQEAVEVAKQFTVDNPPTPKQFSEIYEKLPKDGEIVGPDGVTYVKRK